ncbi:MAG: macro domain-containing protein [Candidatus Aenigmatarchaeota archaeon]
MKIEILKGDITEIEAVAIVNAADSHLSMGGGVARAIRKAGGHDFYLKSRKILEQKYSNGLPTGEALITPSKKMDNCKYVIHTVGPRYGLDKPEDELLRKAYNSSLVTAEKNNIKSIAFPSISTGIFGYPIGEAVKIVKNTLDNWNHDLPKTVKLILHSQEDYEIYRKEFE